MSMALDERRPVITPYDGDKCLHVNRSLLCAGDGLRRGIRIDRAGNPDDLLARAQGN